LKSDETSDLYAPSSNATSPRMQQQGTPANSAKAPVAPSLTLQGPPPEDIESGRISLAGANRVAGYGGTYSRGNNTLAFSTPERTPTSKLSANDKQTSVEQPAGGAASDSNDFTKASIALPAPNAGAPEMQAIPTFTTEWRDAGRVGRLSSAQIAAPYLDAGSQGSVAKPEAENEVFRMQLSSTLELVTENNSTRANENISANPQAGAADGLIDLGLGSNSTRVNQDLPGNAIGSSLNAVGDLRLNINSTRANQNIPADAVTGSLSDFRLDSNSTHADQKMPANQATREADGVIELGTSSNSARATQSIPANTGTGPLDVLVERPKVDQARDVSGTEADRKAFDADPGLKRLPAPVQGVQGKSTTATEEAQVTAGKQIPSKFDQDRQTDGNSPYTDVLKPTSGQQDILAPTPGRAFNANSDQPVSASRVSLSEPIQSSHSTPANQMSVRVEAGSGQVINVRFLNQGGQVEVAVRSSDPTTASQLRQELTSLAGNLDRIGWKTDFTGTQLHQTSALHDTSGSDRNSQETLKGSNLDWGEGPPKKKSPAPEFWDELRDRQDT
jgi:hypothetical protein